MKKTSLSEELSERGLLDFRSTDLSVKDITCTVFRTPNIVFGVHYLMTYRTDTFRGLGSSPNTMAN